MLFVFLMLLLFFVLLFLLLLLFLSTAIDIRSLQFKKVFVLNKLDMTTQK